MFKQNCNVHGFLYFNEIEEEIIRHPEFNRLADVKQLGYAYKAAYKGATHSRLAHSLGTCFLSREIVKDTILKNRELLLKSKDIRNLPNENELNEIESQINSLSAAALLHDINHVPYSHLIQHNLLRSYEIILSESGFENRIDNFYSCKKFDSTHRENVKNILIKSRHRNFKYAGLFHEIIRGDLGASTLDFVARDHLKCGFGKLDLDRPYDSFLFVKVRNKVRIALDIRLNTFPLTMVYNILFNRFKLAQRVYFHRTTTAAEAMIGRAIRRLLELGETKRDNILNDFILKNENDYRFMCFLEDHSDSIIKKIGSALKTRQLYDEAFTLEWKTEDDPIRPFLCENFIGEDNFMKCKELEQAIAKEFDIAEDRIIIFCH
ncbi:MAG: hypothetical protein SFU99_05050, partial [Saprospiraceae bacterium]|nr:hypothetical protein [Saprospiraceae bacterium]